MRLSGGRCALCTEVTADSVLWAGRVRFLRVWCCDRHVAHLGELERAGLTEAAAELELERQRQSAQPVSTPSA